MRPGASTGWAPRSSSRTSRQGADSTLDGNETVTLSTISDTYRALFCQIYGVEAPVVPLGMIIHWSAIVRETGLADLAVNSDTAYIPDGYFYAVHNEVPDAAGIRDAMTSAAVHDADWVLYPVLRSGDRTDELAAAGFTPIPWFVEAEYRVRADVDTDLRAQLGNGRYRDLRRLVRRAEQSYRHEILTGTELAGMPDRLIEFDRLHQLHMTRYGHCHNHLSAPALHLMLNSPLSPGLVLFVRYHDRTAQPVQAALSLLDPSGRELTLLAQGIDRAAVPAGHNLYRTWFYEMYRWGVAHGVEVFNLGRGAEQKKLDMGANTFHLLDNHLAPTRRRDTADVHAMRQKLVPFFADVRRHLADTVQHRETGQNVELHW